MISSHDKLKKSFSEFVSLTKEKNSILFDIQQNTSQRFVKNAIYFAFTDKFKVLFPQVAKLDSPILFVLPVEKSDEILQTVQTLGYTNIIGYLEGGIEVWLQNHGEVSEFSSVEPEKFKDLVESKTEEVFALDVRNKPEWETGVLAKSKLVSLKDLEQEITSGKLDEFKTRHLHIFCQLGLRGMIGSSILQKYGFKNVTYVIGGVKRIVEAGIKLEKANF